MMNDETKAAAKIVWHEMNEDERAGVRFGMLPAEYMTAGRDFAVALMQCAKDDGGMVA